MNRRQFLRPQRLLPTAAQMLGVAEELRTLEQTGNPSTEPALLRCARPAMATTFEVILPFGTPCAPASAAAALDAVDRLEGQLSVYRQDSEVSRLNRLAPLAPVPVEEKLFQLLSLAACMTRATAGAFDVAVGALIKAWGFYRRQGRLPTPEERAEALTHSGMQHVVLDAEKRQVHYLRPGLEINLGSIGKGHALDRAVAILRDRDVASALLHSGHSSIFALGNEPGRKRGWTVGLRHPVANNRRLGVWQLRDQALGTSAATYQHLSYNDRKLGHLLDPRSGWPAEGILGATATAPSAAEADALATAFFVLGVDRARAYCQAHPDIGAVLLPNLPGSRPIVLGTAVEDFHLDT